jgi:hypothetical protein
MKKVQTDDGQAIRLHPVEGLEVTILSNPHHEWLISTTDVAQGYGVDRRTIDSHKSNHKGEIVEGVHFVKGAETFGTLPNSQPHAIYWTKAGVIRLGFYVKSERAKVFRDWAEQVVLQQISAPPVRLPQAVRKQHNRLTKDRLVEILAVVALVDDKAVRTALVQKLMPGMDVPGLQLQLPLGGGKGGERS